MLTGQIYCTTDPQMVFANLNKFKIITLNDADPNFKQATACLEAKLLMPPYNVMAYYADGDMLNFTSKYFEYLTSYDPMLYISAMLKSLYMGVNLLIFMSGDEFELYFNVLDSFFTQSFGVGIGVMGTQKMFVEVPNPITTARICDTLYINNLITVAEFVQLYPRGYQIPDNIIMPLANDFGIQPDSMSMTDLKSYIFIAINNGTISNDHVMAPGIMVTKKC